MKRLHVLAVRAWPLLVARQALASEPEGLNAPPVRAPTTLDRLLSDAEVQLAIAVLVFGFFMFVGLLLVGWKKDFEPQTLMRMSIVTLVIVGTLFLITAGLTSQQIAPAIGLFGTITGYLLGKQDPDRKP